MHAHQLVAMHESWKDPLSERTDRILRSVEETNSNITNGLVSFDPNILMDSRADTREINLSV